MAIQTTQINHKGKKATEIHKAFVEDRIPKYHHYNDFTIKKMVEQAGISYYEGYKQGLKDMHGHVVHALSEYAKEAELDKSILGVLLHQIRFV